MTDRELLELAAKAAGYDIEPHPNRRAIPSLLFVKGNSPWSPLTDDGDALRPASEWTEDDGEVLWWRVPIEEAPYVGSPMQEYWDDHYYNYWTPLPEVKEAK